MSKLDRLGSIIFGPPGPPQPSKPPALWRIPMPEKPHRCPVCEGRGFVPAGFYGSQVGTNPIECRACGGKGIVWRPA